MWPAILCMYLSKHLCSYTLAVNMIKFEVNSVEASLMIDYTYSTICF